jgi:hypothetical protein
MSIRNLKRSIKKNKNEDVPVAKHKTNNTPEWVNDNKIPLIDFIDPTHGLKILGDEVFKDNKYPGYDKTLLPDVNRICVGFYVGMILFRNITFQSVSYLYRENPYLQYFSGEVYFRTEDPISEEVYHTWLTSNEEFLQDLQMHLISTAFQSNVLGVLGVDLIMDGEDTQYLTFDSEEKRYHPITGLRVRKVAKGYHMNSNNQKEK